MYSDPLLRLYFLLQLMSFMLPFRAKMRPSATIEGFRHRTHTAAVYFVHLHIITFYCLPYRCGSRTNCASSLAYRPSRTCITVGRFTPAATMRQQVYLQVRLRLHQIQDFQSHHWPYLIAVHTKRAAKETFVRTNTLYEIGAKLTLGLKWPHSEY